MTFISYYLPQKEDHQFSQPELNCRIFPDPVQGSIRLKNMQMGVHRPWFIIVSHPVLSIDIPFACKGFAITRMIRIFCFRFKKAEEVPDLIHH